MRTNPAVLAVLVLCALAPVASAEPAAAEPRAYDEATNPFLALTRTSCSSAVIAATEHCLRQVASALVVDDKCSNFAAFSKCWPECFCDHPDGYAKIVQPLHGECTQLPACGSAA